jgi:hypothetical protein
MNGANAYLEDKYLKTAQPLSMTDTNRISFTITADATSFDPGRFRIVFGKSTLQPVVPAKKSFIKVYPNPVKDQQIHLQLNEVEKGRYTIRLVNLQGQPVVKQIIEHNGSSSPIVIALNKKISAGIYYLEVVNANDSYRQNILIE